MEQHPAARQQLPIAREIEEEKNALTGRIESGEVPWSGDHLTQLTATFELIALNGRAKFNSEIRFRRKVELHKHLAAGETALDVRSRHAAAVVPPHCGTEHLGRRP